AFAYGTQVTLTAQPAVGSVFFGWSGDCVGSSTTFLTSASAARNVTAQFDVEQVTLTIDVTPPNINVVLIPWLDSYCGNHCVYQVSYGQPLTVTAHDNGGGWQLTGWSGG